MGRWREVQVEAWPGGEPSAYFGMLVRGVVVDDEMRD